MAIDGIEWENILKLWDNDGQWRNNDGITLGLKYVKTHGETSGNTQLIFHTYVSLL